MAILDKDQRDTFINGLLDELFTNGSGEVGTRLQIMQHVPGTQVEERNLGGWSRPALFDRIKAFGASFDFNSGGMDSGKEE